MCSHSPCRSGERVVRVRRRGADDRLAQRRTPTARSCVSRLGPRSFSDAMGGRRSPRAKGAEPRLPGRLEAEAVAVTLGALGAFVEIALLSYQPADPLFARGVRVENWCGPAG